MADIRDELGPEYKAALDREALTRSAAFLGVTELIGGVEVQPLTLLHLCRLECVGSPFVKGGVPMPEDVALFLWAVSKEYDPKAWFKRWRFCRRVSKLSYAVMVANIREYLDEAFLDAPEGRGNGFTAPYWSSYAGIVANIAAEFGWSESEIVNMPLKRVWQYDRIAAKWNSSKADIRNKHSERVRRECLDRINNSRR